MITDDVHQINFEVEVIMSTISRKVKITFPLFIVSCLLFELRIKKVIASIFNNNEAWSNVERF